MVAQPVPIPAPYGGMNTRDGVATLQPSEARYLENWTPQGNSVTLRDGYRTYSSGAASSVAVKTLTTYEAPSAQRLIGANGGQIWDFTNNPAVSVYDGSYTNDRWQTECYSGYLFGVNGTDQPWVYNGTTATNATGFTGPSLSLTHLVNIKQVRNRLWFCENDSADVWYGNLGAITGSLTKFQLSQISAGGYCMAIGSHSQDSGNGPDDYTSFVMSTGEVILYSGDPSTTFSLVGKYWMPPPVGRQCLVNIGGPLAVLTRAGLIPLQAAVSGLAFDALGLGNYGKLQPTLKEDADLYGANEGWQVVSHNGLIIINVPVSATVSKQRVYNYLNGAWTTWTGHNAASIGELDGELYYGLTTDGVVRHMTGKNDDGAAIATKARLAFVQPNGGIGATASAARFDMQIDGYLIGRFGIDVDYGETDVTGYASQTLASGIGSTPWGSDWGASWSTTRHYPGKWYATYGEGRSFALVIEASASASRVDWFGSQLMGQQSQTIL